MIGDVSSSISEIAEMGATDKMTFTFNDLGADKGQGYLSTKKSGDKVVTVINYTYPSKDDGNGNNINTNRIHEASHGFQFFKYNNVMFQTPEQIGTNSFTFKGTNPRELMNVIEIISYQRQFSFAPNSMSASPLNISNRNDVNKAWLYGLKDPVSGDFLYKPKN